MADTVASHLSIGEVLALLRGHLSLVRRKVHLVRDQHLNHILVVAVGFSDPLPYVIERFLLGDVVDEDYA